MLDLVIRNGLVVEPNAARVADVAISGGRIAAIGPGIADAARATIDAAGLIVFPGGIDAHVHFNEPGRTEWEGIATGSRAAAVGGVTCFADMPLNSTPPVVTAAAFDAKHAAATAQSQTDFAIWGGLVPGHLADLPELAARGVIGFKAFMANSGIDDFAAADDATLRQGMEIAARLDRPVAVHAEDDVLTTRLANEALAAGKITPRDYLDSRPIEAELLAIARAIQFAAETGCQLHIVHVSSAAGVALVTAARANGTRVTCETCPHYLALTENDVIWLGAVAKCAPPIRAADEVAKLWEEVLAGRVDLLASDHSPAPWGMKTDANFFRVWGGIAGCQTLLPLMFCEAHRERSLPLTKLAQLLAAGPARVFRLPNKGVLRVGYDADLTLIDPQAGVPLTEKHLEYRHKLSPYLGRPIHGLVRRTLLRGETIYAIDEPPPEKPRGKLVWP